MSNQQPYGHGQHDGRYGDGDAYQTNPGYDPYQQQQQHQRQEQQPQAQAHAQSWPGQQQAYDDAQEQQQYTQQ